VPLIEALNTPQMLAVASIASMAGLIVSIITAFIAGSARSAARAARMALKSRGMQERTKRIHDLLIELRNRIRLRQWPLAVFVGQQAHHETHEAVGLAGEHRKMKLLTKKVDAIVDKLQEDGDISADQKAILLDVLNNAIALCSEMSGEMEGELAYHQPRAPSGRKK